MMLLTLDHLARRYHLMPSQVLAQGTTLDLRCMEIGSAWAREQDPNQRKLIQAERREDLTQEQMQQRIDQVRANPPTSVRHRSNGARK